MKVTFTNAHPTETIYVSQLYKALIPGETVTTTRDIDWMRRDLQMCKLIQAGKLTLTLAKETGDDAGFGAGHVAGSFTDLTRPLATTFPSFTSIWNSDDLSLNWSDGLAWRDSDGNLT